MTFLSRDGSSVVLELVPKDHAPQDLTTDQRRIARGLILHRASIHFSPRDLAAIFRLKLRTVQLDLANASATIAAAHAMGAGDD